MDTAAFLVHVKVSRYIASETEILLSGVTANCAAGKFWHVIQIVIVDDVGTPLAITKFTFDKRDFPVERVDPVFGVRF